MRSKSLKDVETTQTSSHYLEDWKDLSLLFFFSMAWSTPTLSKMKTSVKGVEEDYLPQQPYGSIYNENQ
jgi:hypothetical protein